MSFFHFLNFVVTSPRNHSNQLILSMIILWSLIMSITFLPNFMIVACSYLAELLTAGNFETLPKKEIPGLI